MTTKQTNFGEEKSINVDHKNQNKLHPKNSICFELMFYIPVLNFTVLFGPFLG